MDQGSVINLWTDVDEAVEDGFWMMFALQKPPCKPDQRAVKGEHRHWMPTGCHTL